MMRDADAQTDGAEGRGTPSLAAKLQSEAAAGILAPFPDDAHAQRRLIDACVQLLFEHTDVVEGE